MAIQESAQFRQGLSHPAVTFGALQVGSKRSTHCLLDLFSRWKAGVRPVDFVGKFIPSGSLFQRNGIRLNRTSGQ